MISGPSPTPKTRLLSFNRTHNRIVTSLLTGHNMLRRYLYVMGLIGSPLCRRCAAEEVTSAHILCECEPLTSLRHTYLDSFFLDPEDVRSLSLGKIWNFSKEIGLPRLAYQIMGHKWPVERPMCIRTKWARTQSLFHLSPKNGLLMVNEDMVPYITKGRTNEQKQIQ